jgi:uncharacterized SAM-binding protein YcdF (DUF218 family)
MGSGADIGDVENVRLVAVLGYSSGHASALHPVCAERLERAELEAKPDDIVLFSGWARRGSTKPEADLMARAWAKPVRRLILDRNARSTVGNAVRVARAARLLSADEVVLVTSNWHARRASTLLRAALLGSGTRVVIATTDTVSPRKTRVRELACWALVPVLALAAARTR